MNNNTFEFSKKQDSKYIPITSILGISSTSYGVQLGEINKSLCLVIYHGKEVILFHNFKEINVKTLPDRDFLTGWILSNLNLPYINSFQVSRTVGFLLLQLNRFNI